MKRAALALALFALAAPAFAQTRAATPIATLDPPSLAAMLRARNYPAEVRRTDDGGWFVSARLNALPFQAVLLNCAPRTTRCTDLQLFARLETPASAARINEWNAHTRFVRAYLDPQNRPVLEMDLSVEGGVGAGNIAAALDLWGGALQSFSAQMRPQEEEALRR